MPRAPPQIDMPSWATMRTMVHLPRLGTMRALAVARAPDAASTQGRPREALGRPSLIVLLALGSVVVSSLIVHLWGIWGDLPYAPDVDEPTILVPVIRMLDHATLNPGWFGNPGSTIIYPIAALSELWYLIANHVPPFAHPMAGISAEFTTNPVPFYLIGRLVSVAYGVGSVVATWLLGRRLIGDAGGVLASLALPATSLAVAHGQLVRTDTAGLFFALIALWLMVRAMDRGRYRDWALAGGAIGLAVASRYFLATLVVPYAVAAWVWLDASLARPRLRLPNRSTDRWLAPAVGLLFVPILFLATSPFVLIHLRRAIADLRHEARAVNPGADGLSPLGNLAWYLGDVIPATFGLGLLVLAAAGAVVVARRNGRATAVLGAFSATYLIGISASPLHWTRYVIPLAPVVGILVAAAVLAIAAALANAVGGWLASRGGAERSPEDVSGDDRRPGRRSISVATAIVVAVLIPSMGSVLAADRLRAAPSTRAVATDWVQANLPPDRRIAEEWYTAYLDTVRPDALRVFTLATRSLDAYRADGYRYLISSSAIADRYQNVARYPTEHAFYASLKSTGRLVASFESGPDRAGSLISVYDIAHP